MHGSVVFGVLKTAVWLPAMSVVDGNYLVDLLIKFRFAQLTICSNSRLRILCDCSFEIMITVRWFARRISIWGLQESQNGSYDKLNCIAEFIDVGKEASALDALYEVIKSRKHRTWQKVHEPIMTLYLKLCVDLKKSHVAKEGLFQYRNICQQVSAPRTNSNSSKFLLCCRHSLGSNDLPDIMLFKIS